VSNQWTSAGGTFPGGYLRLYFVHAKSENESTPAEPFMTKLFTAAALALWSILPLFAAGRPNVLVVLTDDQGFGDMGVHRNPILKTPNIDAFAKAGLRMKQFYVSPVCSPTRASLMTGRYNYRTGAVDTFLGRSMMFADEVTIAEVLREHSYRTGLFGKWHLGDCYPMRPQDQGFDEVLMNRGGGIGQPSDPPGGSSYIDPILFHNGEAKKFKGYVTDVLTDAAIDFVAAKSDMPFFAYVAYNCPHAPYQVTDADWKPYRGIDLGPDAFPKFGSPWAGKKLNQEEIGKAYGMIANIDKNFGRLIARVPDNTLVIFLSDNGVGGERWNAGLRNRKGSVYEGGIRVPFFVQWKGHFSGGRDIDMPAAHIDLAPTILDACGLAFPKDIKIDGRSMLSLWKGDDVNLPVRDLFFQWHRGDVPEMGRAFAVRGPKFKLVQAAGVNPGKYEPKLELFDLANDPSEQKDLAKEKPEVVRELQASHENWFRDVKSTRNFAAPRIHLGSPKEKVTTLTRQDWRGPNAGWTPESEGHWDVTVTRAGKYRLTVDFEATSAMRTATVNLGDVSKTAEVPAGKDRVVFDSLTLPKGDGKLEALLQGEKRLGVKFVEVEWIGDSR
jgi:arylsulfatase A-like enzyme